MYLLFEEPAVTLFNFFAPTGVVCPDASSCTSGEAGKEGVLSGEVGEEKRSVPQTVSVEVFDVEGVSDIRGILASVWTELYVLEEIRNNM